MGKPNRHPICPDVTNIDQDKLGAHVYVSYNPDGSENVLHIREDADLQWHIEAYDMHERVHITADAPLYNHSPCAHWPIDHPVKRGDVQCHKIHNNQLCMCPVKSQKVHTDRLREKRIVYLKYLDVESMKNIESGLDNSEILKAKQVLRDMPLHKAWNKCKTLDDFKNMTIDDILTQEKINPKHIQKMANYTP
jgi:hypothetical protein